MIEPAEQVKSERIEKQIWNIIDLMIKPEKCDKCGKWKNPIKVIENNYKTESIMRKCTNPECH